MSVRVTPFQLLQFKHWLRMEERAGRALQYKGRSVKAHAARILGLPPRTRRLVVLKHVEAALAACKAANVPMTAVADLQETTPLKPVTLPVREGR